MPRIYNTKCCNCGVTFPSGWGGNLYAVNDDGERIWCLHPGELADVKEITGMSLEEAEAAGRVGFSSYCMCFSCGRQFELDLERDSKRCPACNASEVLSARESVGEKCPHCLKGIFIKEDTEFMS